MFGIGWTEFLIIALVLLIFVGPENLPAFFKKVAIILSEFKAAGRELRNQIDEETKDIESPVTILRNAGKDIIDVPYSPYSEIEEEEKKLKQAISRADSDKTAEDKKNDDDGLKTTPSKDGE
jgi:sec-independent protein translocase protein TatB